VSGSSNVFISPLIEDINIPTDIKEDIIVLKLAAQSYTLTPVAYKSFCNSLNVYFKVLFVTDNWSSFTFAEPIFVEYISRSFANYLYSAEPSSNPLAFKML
jgi:hypothetical protein